MDCGYSLESPRRGGSNEHPRSMFLSRNMKNIRIFLSENFHFLVVKFSVYLNRRVFVMLRWTSFPEDEVYLHFVLSQFSAKPFVVTTYALK